MQLADDFRRLTGNRPLTALVAARAISALGDWLYLAALPIIVYEATGDAAIVGIAAAGRLLPFLLLSVPAGVIADRVDHRRILVVTESLRCGLMLAMTALYLTDAEISLLIGVATLAGAAGTVAMPAVSALTPGLARSGDELGFANAASSTLESAASVLGPATAAILALVGGLGLACAINAVSFAIVVAILVASRSEPVAARRSTTEEDGRAPGCARPDEAQALLDVIRRVTRPIILDAGVSFACGGLGVLPVVIAVDQLRAGEAFVGMLGAAGGLGAVAGGVAAGALINRSALQAMAAGIVTATVALGLLAAGKSELAALAAISIAIGALVVLDTLNVTALQRTVPGRHLGRAFGVLHTSAAAWLMAGSAFPPLVAGAAGVGAALGLIAAVVATLGGLSLLGASNVAVRSRTPATESASA